MQPGRLHAGVAPACGRQGPASVDNHPGVEYGGSGSRHPTPGIPHLTEVCVVDCSSDAVASTTFGICSSRPCFSNVCSPWRSCMQCLISARRSNGTKDPRSSVPEIWAQAMSDKRRISAWEPKSGIFAARMPGTTDQCHPPSIQRLLYPARSHWVPLFSWVGA